MTALLLITSGIILLCLSYPVFVMACPVFKSTAPGKKDMKQAVSLILITYNGIDCLREKIVCLYRELRYFDEFELIVIDDNSTDGTREQLESLKDIYGFRLILKNEHRGIPHSMNLGAQLARYDLLIFCDQRQKCSENILREIIAPLQFEEVGAVSGYISSLDSENHRSILREIENFIKKQESKAGCLIGVYGPLYAIRKGCYEEIEKDIILDDLYLSLKILATKKIVLVENCKITDNDFLTLYDFKRSQRYLKGFFQLLVCKDLVKPLPARIKVMLIWHKYVRLLIPPLLFLCYLGAAILSFDHPSAAIIFISLTGLFLISLAGRKMAIFHNLNTVLRVSVFYFISLISMAIHRMSPKAFSDNRTNKKDRVYTKFQPE